MALILGQVFGDMTGKVGGIVFTRNKAGKVIRSYVKPTDAKTSQQLAVRGRLAASASTYHGLTTAQLSTWANYASTIYTPKHAKNTVAFSGFNAFVGVNQIAACQAKAAATFAFTTPAATITQLNSPSSILTPAGSSFNSTITKSDSTAIGQSLTSIAYVAATRIATITVALSQITGATAPTFSPVGGTGHCGYALYFSTPLGTSAVRAANNEAYLMAATTTISVTAGWTTTSSIVMTVTVSSGYLAQLKASFNAGQRVIATLYSVNDLGQMARIGNTIVTIS